MFRNKCAELFRALLQLLLLQQHRHNDDQALEGLPQEGRHADQVLISCSMLRENGDCFLDDMTLSQVQEAVGLPIRVVKNSGKAFLDALYGLE